MRHKFTNRVSIEGEGLETETMIQEHVVGDLDAQIKSRFSGIRISEIKFQRH